MTRFLQNWLLALAWLHLAIGLAIPFIAHSALFDHYSALLQTAFWPGQSVPAEALSFQRWIVSLFGPTLASVGVVMIHLVRAGIRTNETWPWNAMLVALMVWAPGDIGISLMRDFWLHVWIDLVALLLIVPPILLLKKRAMSASTALMASNERSVP